MGLEDFDQALIFGAVLVEPLELETGRTEGTRGRVAQTLDGRGALARAIDQVLLEGADDAVASGIDLADFLRIARCGLDDAGGRGVDDGGHTAGLGVKRVAGGGLFHGAGAYPTV